MAYDIILKLGMKFSHAIVLNRFMTAIKITMGSGFLPPA
jgi:hypothetical protein